MARNTGITTQTAQRMMLDAGAVYINYGETEERVLGATRGGNEFVIEQEVREIEVDGLRGPGKGLRRIVSHHVRLTVNLLEMNAQNIVDALPGASSATNTETTHDVVTQSMLMSDINYLTNVALVADYSGSTDPVIIVVKNALADGGFTLSANDREEGTTEVQFTGHFDLAAMDEAPYEIRMPVEA